MQPSRDWLRIIIEINLRGWLILLLCVKPCTLQNHSQAMTLCLPACPYFVSNVILIWPLALASSDQIIHFL
jgi:hypothetical protein